MSYIIKRNALKLHLENGDWICVRPSGTEPKLKIYGATSAPTKCTLCVQFMKAMLSIHGAEREFMAKPIH